MIIRVLQVEFYEIFTQKLLRHKQKNLQLCCVTCSSLQHPNYNANYNANKYDKYFLYFINCKICS